MADETADGAKAWGSLLSAPDMAAAFAWPPRAGSQLPLTILHLNPSAVATAGLRPDDAQPPDERADPEGGIVDRLASAWAARSAARSPISYSDSAGITKKAD